MELLFVIHREDNVAVALEDVAEGIAKYSGAVSGNLRITEPVPKGHKAAISPIHMGGAIVKHGHMIAEATSEIFPGQWVHTHNAKSPERKEAEGT